MRPLTLEIHAFGPYYDKVFLDFSQLKEQNIFIINGPTGAGKTTVLDAIVYALYGCTSGQERTGETMRSHYADEKIETRVDFSFAIGDEKYRILRSPKQIVQKKRGLGTREIGAQAILFTWHNGDWKEIATKSNEIKDKVFEIIGFRVDQFLQVVLLPQGEFRKLLLASSADRAAIMESLFHTEIYRRVRSTLKADADQLAEQNKDFVIRESVILDEEGVSAISDLEEKLKNLQCDKNMAEISLQAAKEALSVWNHTLGIEEKRQECTQRLQSNYAEEAKLLEQEEAMKQLEADIDALLAYKEVKPYLEEEKELVRHEAKYKEDENKRKILLTSLHEEKKSIDKEKIRVAKGAIRQKDIEQELIRLENQEIELSNYKIIKDNLLAYEKEEKGLVDKEQRIRADLHARELSEKEIIKKISVSEETISKGITLAEQIVVAQNNLKERQRRDEAMAHVEKEQQRLVSVACLQKKEEVVKEAKRIWKSAEFTYQSAQAYLLGQTLKDGQPCPVCGSLEHPNLAIEPEEIVSKEDVERLYNSYSTAQIEWQKLTQEQASISSYIKNEYSKIEGIEKENPLPSMEEIESFLESLQIAYAAWKNEEQFLHSLKTERSNIQGMIKEKNRELQEIKEKQGANNANIRQSQARLTEIERIIPEGSRDSIRLHEQMKCLQAELKQLCNEEQRLQEQEQLYKEKWDSTCGAQEEAQKQHSERIDRLLVIRQSIATCVARGSFSLTLQETYEENLKNLSTWQEKVHTYKDELKRIFTVRHELTSALEILPVESVPLDQVQAFVEDSQKTYDQELSHYTQLVGEYDRLVKRVRELEKLRHNNVALQEKYELVHMLSELASGGRSANYAGFTFENFVLRAILEEVVMAANERLQQMSRNRYSLARAPLVGSGKGYQGLDLEIYDAFTGYARPSNTLSGGETFLASLSLALGMADIIQAYAGGIHLDTIFVDEGFGTLDPETLEVALQAILQLQEHGRLVGLISHVPELKERINAKLTVKKTDRGSIAFFETTA